MKNSIKRTLVVASLLASSSFAQAQDHADHQAHHDHNADPILTHIILDEFEFGDANRASSLSAQAWIGKDLNKFWLKTELERYDGETENGEVQALYSHAISPYWDLQLGLRSDIRPKPTRDWAVIGVEGLAPYFFNIDAAIFIGDSNRIATRVKAEYDLLFNQRLILSPSVTVNAYGQNDLETRTGAGLADMDLGLRLRYEVRREFAPYMGLVWQKKFGNTADMAEVQQEPVSDSQWVLGLRAWY